jgi:hypothetical protein
MSLTPMSGPRPWVSSYMVAMHSLRSSILVLTSSIMPSQVVWSPLPSMGTTSDSPPCLMQP